MIFNVMIRDAIWENPSHVDMDNFAEITKIIKKCCKLWETVTLDVGIVEEKNKMLRKEEISSLLLIAKTQLHSNLHHMLKFCFTSTHCGGTQHKCNIQQFIFKVSIFFRIIYSIIWAKNPP